MQKLCIYASLSLTNRMASALHPEYTFENFIMNPFSSKNISQIGCYLDMSISYLHPVEK